MSGARCLWRRWCSGRRRARPPAWCALLGRAAWCARGRRPAREPSALRASLGASSRSPARPRRRPRAPQPGPPDPPTPSTPAALVSLCVVELPIEARPGPAAAHGCRSLALRHPGLAVLLLVAPLVFWAPSGPAAWPGCLVCPWAAARPRALRAASFARRVASKPGQAPPPAHGHRSLALWTLRRPPHRRRLRRCVWWSFPSKPGQALPPPMGAAGRLSGPSGALHAGGAAGICN